MNYMCGSPPHAWGRFLIALIKRKSKCRFTPTCVGQMSLVLFRLASGTAVHPHMRGADEVNP